MWSSLVALLLTSTLARGWEYKVQNPPLDTDWTYKVGTSPWPEYPRPQLARERWTNLNGIWSYRNAGSKDEVHNPPTGDLGQGVLIPSCLESGLSGQFSLLYYVMILALFFTSTVGHKVNTY